MKRFFIALICIAITAGCQQSRIRPEDSPWFRLPVGSTLQLNQDIEVFPEHARAFLQGGKSVQHGEIDEFSPYCNFEVREVSGESSQWIRRDRFVITRTQQGSDFIFLGYGYWPMANLRTGRSFFRHRPYPVNRHIHYWVRSGGQPDVMRLTCFSGRKDYWMATYPTLNEIRDALGDRVSIVMTH